ncbi:UNVERIFIED_CONTAM: hypothetical protein K2H54_007400 [Gekko kuhli]
MDSKTHKIICNIWGEEGTKPPTQCKTSKSGRWEHGVEAWSRNGNPGVRGATEPTYRHHKSTELRYRSLTSSPWMGSNKKDRSLFALQMPKEQKHCRAEK